MNYLPSVRARGIPRKVAVPWAPRPGRMYQHPQDLTKIEAGTSGLSVDCHIEWDGLLTFTVVVNNGQIKPHPTAARRSPREGCEGVAPG